MISASGPLRLGDVMGSCNKTTRAAGIDSGKDDIVASVKLSTPTTRFDRCPIIALRSEGKTPGGCARRDCTGGNVKQSVEDMPGIESLGGSDEPPSHAHAS